MKPKIVCLCGSTRFGEAYQKANFDETLAGNIVLTIGCNTKSDQELFSHLSQEEMQSIKSRLDELHKRKIDLADEILVLNAGGYVGESTRGEIAYAVSHGKSVRWLEPETAEAYKCPHCGTNEHPRKSVFVSIKGLWCPTCGKRISLETENIVSETDEKDLPEWYHIIKGILREYECFDMKMFEENGGYTAYSLLRQAAEREIKLTASELESMRKEELAKLAVKQLPLMEPRSRTGRLPCPFCGSVDLSLVLYGVDKKPLLIKCNKCGASGPLGETIEQLDALWDVRSTLI